MTTTAPPKHGSLAHARLILQAGFMLYDNDPRFPKRVFDQLERGLSRMGYCYPHPLKPVRWFCSLTLACVGEVDTSVLKEVTS